MQNPEFSESNLELELKNEIAFRQQVSKMIEQGLSPEEIEQILRMQINWELFGIVKASPEEESSVAVQEEFDTTIVIRPKFILSIPDDLFDATPILDEIQKLKNASSLNHNLLIHAMQEQNKHVTTTLNRFMFWFGLIAFSMLLSFCVALLVKL